MNIWVNAIDIKHVCSPLTLRASYCLIMDICNDLFIFHCCSFDSLLNGLCVVKYYCYYYYMPHGRSLNVDAFAFNAKSRFKQKKNLSIYFASIFYVFHPLFFRLDTCVVITVDIMNACMDEYDEMELIYDEFLCVLFAFMLLLLVGVY